MKIVFLSLALLVSFVCAAGSQPKNEAVSTGNYFDGEPNLAVNPTDQNNMIVAWMGYDVNAGGTLLERISIHVRSSFDGGKTWGNDLLMPHYSAKFHSADVTMAFHHDGTLYICYIDYSTVPPHDSGVIVVAHSSDGGRTFSEPVKAFDAYDNNDLPIDRPWMVVDNSGTASDGMVYITTKSVYWDPLPNHPYIKSSHDGGATWSAIANVDGGNYVSDLIVQPMATPAVSADGMLNIVYPSWPKVTSPVQFILARSADNGASFSRSVVYTPVAGAGGDTLSKLGYHLATNPMDAKKMVVAGIDKRNGDNDVYAFATSDGGASWTSGTRVNDDPVGDGIWQDLVWANFSDDGKCLVSWRDRRNGDSTGYEQGSDIYFAVSDDGGKTFGKNIRLSDSTAAWTKVLDAAGNDFHSTAIVHDSICAAWGDTRTGKLGIYFAKASLSNGNASVIRVSGDDNTFQIYPNPATGSVSFDISFEKTETSELFIFDETGKEVLHQPAATTSAFHRSVDVSGLSSGTYFAVLKTPEQIVSRSFIVSH